VNHPAGTRPEVVRGRRARWFAAVSTVVGVGVLVLGVVVVGRRWDEVRAALDTIGWPAALGCLVLTTFGVIATGECWRQWLVSLGGDVAPLTAHRLFYVTQAGKYVPGSLWPVLAQAMLARRYGVGRSAIVAASTLFLLLHTVTGVLVGVVGVGATIASEWTWLVIPVAVGGVVLLLPPVLGRLLHALARWRPALATTSPTWGATGRASALMLLAWACYGTATWLLLRPLDDSAAALPLAVGGYALAWVVGFLAVAAPAGVGAREAVLVAVLGPLVGVSAALSVALVSRVALTVADLGLAAASAGVLRQGFEPDPADPRDPPDPEGAGPHPVRSA
jgi:glycosyltransferase 2 family protein